MKYRKLISLLLLCTLCLSACGRKVTTWQEQYDLGVRYLSEGNYEEAIIAFNAAIDIDPMQVDTYLSLADLYLSQGDSVAARELLASGFELTGDKLLSEAINKINVYQINITNETPQQGVLKVYRTKVSAEGWLENTEEVPSGGYVPADDARLSFEAKGMAGGYRIGQLMVNGEDWTSHLVYGGYGVFAMDISQLGTDLDITFSMEKIDENSRLPTITGVSIEERVEDESGRGRVLYAWVEPSDISFECNYIWEYRDPDSNEWSEVYFWRNHHTCTVKPFESTYDDDLSGKYVRVTAKGKPNYSEGSITSSEYYVNP